MAEKIQRLRNLNVLLASTAPQKIEATILGLNDAIPLQGKDKVWGRRFMVEEHKEGEVVRTERKQGLEKVLPRRVIGPINRVLRTENRVTVVAFKAPSSVPEQPIVERRSAIEQGFQGAANRLQAAIDINAASKPSVIWDFAIGIENALVGMTAPNGRETQIDTGFVVIQDDSGHQSIAPSAGVVFGENLGVDLFTQSQVTGFTKPAGHLYSPEDPQDPHKKATGGKRSRVDLLKDAIVIAYTGLPKRI